MQECTSSHNQWVYNWNLQRPAVDDYCIFILKRKLFGVIVQSMLEIGFEEEEIEDIYNILAAVILIGDIVR